MKAGPPLRLRDDPSVGAALRRELARTPRSSDLGAGYDVAAGLARHEAALQAGPVGAGPGPGPGAVAGAKPMLGLALKGTLLAVVAIGGIGAGVVASRSPASRAAPSAASVAIAPVVSASPVASVPVPSLPTPLDAPPPAPRAQASAASPAASAPRRHVEVPPEPIAELPAPSASATSSPSPLALEMEHLARLRALETSDPAEALASAVEGNRRFASGQFAQEREAIAIGALVRLGRGAEARARAEVFMAAYPRSAFVERVRKLTGMGKE